MTIALADTTGVDFLRSVNTLEMPPYVGTLLGLIVEEAEPGRVVLSMKTRPEFANFTGAVHGGITAALIDAAMGSAVHSTLEFGVGYSTLELSVNYVRPVPAAAGVVLTATATTIHVGRRTATVDCRVHDPEGRLVAHGTSTCMVLR
jgi:uncharacterized protein (TIGR00369 family)